MYGEELLPDADKAYFSRFERIFESDDFKFLSDEWRKDIDQLPVRAFWQAKSWDEILAARALVDKLREYLAYPAQLDLRKEHRIVELQDAVEEAQDAARPDV